MTMVWTGTPLRVKVTQPAGGGFDPNFSRDVYALEDDKGMISVLVVDDAGRLEWVTGSDNFVVIGGRRQG